MTNQPGDLTTITDLFDRIAFSDGGTREIGGLWATERALLIAEVTAEIVRFQTINNRPVVDGVIDPGGGTLKLMNQLASEPSPVTIRATVMPAPDGLAEAVGPKGMFVVEPSSLPGLGQMRKLVANTSYVRKLVRVDGSSITWYGVVVPRTASGQAIGRIPHINFTPTPIQGGYIDANYGSFAGWGGLWNDYTELIGGQLAASGADQVLVIPFYKTSQQRNLGDFLSNWREVVSAVATAALNAVDPFFLRNTFTFDRIVSSSFSNGYLAHQIFNTQAVRAASMTDFIFDLDGQAGGSTWRPANGVIYQNRMTPGRANPVGNNWYVGNRWSDFKSLYGGGYVNGHAASRNHLLYHGLWLMCT
ncbi:MAG: hypothetical protein ACRENP_07705 [Longimicrobiales bacterium]